MRKFHIKKKTEIKCELFSKQGGNLQTILKTSVFTISTIRDIEKLSNNKLSVFKWIDKMKEMGTLLQCNDLQI